MSEVKFLLCGSSGAFSMPLYLLTKSLSDLSRFNQVFYGKHHVKQQLIVPKGVKCLSNDQLLTTYYCPSNLL